MRLLFFSNPGFEKVDTNDFKIWFSVAADNGPRAFYNLVWCDYPPFNIYFFWIFGSIAKNLSLFGSNLFLYIMKLPSNLFDMATVALIFVFVRKRLSFKLALLAAGLYAFNPAVIFNAAVWGQFDAIYTFLLVLSLYLIFESKPKWAMVAFMLGVLTKPQSIAIAPLVLFLIFRKSNWNWKKIAVSVLVAVVTIFAVILPFNWSNPVTFLSNIYFGAYSTYGETSVNAFNIWGIGGVRQPDTQFTFLLGWAMFASLAVFVLYFVHKRSNSKVSNELIVLLAALVLFFGFFMLPTRIHERYLFPAMSMLALMFPFLRRMRPMYIVLTITCFVNQAYVLSFLNTENPFISSTDPVAYAVSLINSIAFIYVLMLMFEELWGRKWLSSSPTKTQVNATEEGSKQCN